MDASDDFVESTVVDPDAGDSIQIDNLKEKELLDLLVKCAQKSKSIRSKHEIRHGWLMDTAKVLRQIYMMNLHRWALDKGISKEQQDFFEHQFKDALCPKPWRPSS